VRLGDLDLPEDELEVVLVEHERRILVSDGDRGCRRGGDHERHDQPDGGQQRYGVAPQP
jgi:hypothetical protein